MSAVSAGAAEPDTLVGPEHVPFVAQAPLLCGGASAAMVLRFWGERDRAALDFGSLVDEEAGGIVADVLAREIDGRPGFRAEAVQDAPDRVFAVLERGAPVVLLIDRGLPVLHYVVLVRADGEHAWIHDPNFGPDRRLTRAELDEAWARSGRWALLVAPDAAGQADTGRTNEGAGHADTETGLRDAGPRAPPPSAGVHEAMEALRAGRHDTARSTARRLVDEGGEDAETGHRILATSFFLEGEEMAALDHWNAVGEPPIDLIDIRGARFTRYHVLARQLPFEAPELLSAERLDLARQRLSLVPSVQASRVDYAPNPDGTTDVEAFVQERARWPTGLMLLVRGVQGLTDDRTEIEAGPLMSSGDRWRLHGGWREAGTHAGFTMATASTAFRGTLDLGMEWRRERHLRPTSTVLVDERVRSWVGLRDQLTTSVSLRGEVGVERWEIGRRLSAGVEAAWRLLDGDGRRLAVVTGADHWRGAGEPFWRVRGLLRAERRITEGQEIRLQIGAVEVGSAAPRMDWPGAGTGEFREPLLRGHPLDVDGTIGGPAFGRRLAHGTAEYRIWERIGPLLLGASTFVDVARAWDGEVPDSGTFIDPGLGLFVDTGEREVRFDFARGGGTWVFSAGVRTPN